MNAVRDHYSPRKKSPHRKPTPSEVALHRALTRLLPLAPAGQALEFSEAVEEVIAAAKALGREHV